MADEDKKDEKAAKSKSSGQDAGDGPKVDLNRTDHNDDEGIVGKEDEIEYDTPQRQVVSANTMTGVKEHSLVPDDEKEPGSGPIVEQHLEDHITGALPPRESDTEKSGASHLDDEWRR